MDTRILLAGMWVAWSCYLNFVAHVFLPLGEMGVRLIPNEDTS